MLKRINCSAYIPLQHCLARGSDCTQADASGKISSCYTAVHRVDQSAAVRTTSMPSVSFVYPADVWFLVCMVFIFVAIMKLAVVNYLDNRRKMQMASRTANQTKSPVKISQINQVNKETALLLALSLLSEV